MAGLQKLDKKQVPQVIGLGVVSCGLFGYFAFKMIIPTASAAPPPPPKAAPAPASAGSVTTSASTGSQTASAAPIPDAPAPTETMRDPFTPLIGLAATTTAAPAPTPTPPPAPAPRETSHEGGSAAPIIPPADLGPLPGMAHLTDSAPAPVVPQTSGSTPLAATPPAAPVWTATGVLQSGGSQVAILRNGAARAYARPGDMVDANFRVVDVTRAYVVLRHGAQDYTLPLGGAKISSRPAKAAASISNTTGQDDHNDQPSNADKSTSFYQDGLSAFSAGKFDEAIDDFHNALAINPNLWEAHARLAMIYDHENLLENAIQEWRSVISVSPGDDGAHIFLAQDLFKDGNSNDRQEAVSECAKVTENSTDQKSVIAAHALLEEYDAPSTTTD